MKIITTQVRKGGAGKTTVTVNLAQELTRKGYKVLVVDFDPQGNTEYGFAHEYDGKPTVENLLSNGTSSFKIPAELFIRRHEETGVDFIPIDKKAQNYMEMQIMSIVNMGNPYSIKNIFADEVFQQYDYILFDCRTSVDTFTQYLFTGSDYVIVPTLCEAYSFDGIASTVDMIEEVKATTNPKLELLGIVINRYQKDLSVQRVVQESIRDNYNGNVFETVLRNYAGQAQNLVFGVKSNTKNFVEQFRQFTDEVLFRIEALEKENG